MFLKDFKSNFYLKSRSLEDNIAHLIRTINQEIDRELRDYSEPQLLKPRDCGGIGWVFIIIIFIGWCLIEYSL